MTKLLYIPNGNYLRFYLHNSNDLTINLEEAGIGAGPDFKTAAHFINYLLHTKCGSRWYEINGIEYGHEFLRCELEIVKYD
jgi:hypothetical protein